MARGAGTGPEQMLGDVSLGSERPPRPRKRRSSPMPRASAPCTPLPQPPSLSSQELLHGFFLLPLLSGKAWVLICLEIQISDFCLSCVPSQAFQFDLGEGLQPRVWTHLGADLRCAQVGRGLPAFCSVQAAGFWGPRVEANWCQEETGWGWPGRED